jgi:hypothetical protein
MDERKAEKNENKEKKERRKKEKEEMKMSETGGKSMAKHACDTKGLNVVLTLRWSR